MIHVAKLSLTAWLLLLSLTVVVQAKKPAPPPPPPPPPPLVSYHLTWVNLPMTPAEASGGTVIRDMNDHGDLVGTNLAAGSPPPRYAWLYTEETGIVNLDDVALPPEEGDILKVRVANGINNGRIIVGICQLNGEWEAFRLPLALDDDGEPIPTPIEILPHPDEAVSMAGAGKINAAGDINIGWYDADGVDRLSLLTEGEYIHTSADKDQNYLSVLGGQGEVGGAAFGANGRTYGFLSIPNFDEGVEDSLTFIPGFVAPAASDSFVSAVSGINNVGEAVGYALHRASSNKNPIALYRSFLRTPDGVMTNLGVLDAQNDWHSWAYDINDVGDVIGSTFGQVTTRGQTVVTHKAFLRTPEHGMMDLTTLVVGDADWDAAERIIPDKINSALSAGGFGQIAGRVRIVRANGSVEWRIFVLTAED